MVQNDAYRGKTPLHEASSEGHAAVAKLLLGSRATVDSKNRHGREPQRGFGSLCKLFGVSFAGVCGGLEAFHVCPCSSKVWGEP